jgi:uncharacterized glyoxalase superfamily protein PhnB
MKFTTTLLAVRDMDKSLKFYKELFDQEVACDLGWNKTLTCGLTLQLNFDKLCGFPEEKMQWRSHNMEIYFETEDIDAFVKLLSEHPEVECLHPLKQYPWRQRVIRIFDPDGHIIEVGESMESVAFHEFAAGHSVEETAEIIQHPLALVQQWHKNYLTHEQK